VRVSRTYCSQLSLAVSEQRFATASRGTLWLLLEHPGPWGLQPPHDTMLPEPAKRYLLRILQEFPSSRVLLIKRERRTAAPLAFFVAVACEREPALYAFTLSSDDELPGIDVAVLATGQHLHATNGERALFLVCTDGKHDYCCAKYGFSIYRELTAYAGDAVWQASHVGGDRFAANVVCFPHGLFYGHVAPEDIQPLADAYRGGHVYLPKYRGRTCYPFVVQAAEYFLRVETGITRTDSLRLSRHTHLGEQIWGAEFSSLADGRVHQVTLRRELSAFSQYLRCSAMQAERVPQYQLLNYRVVEARREG
jgi:hypothetical protein